MDAEGFEHVALPEWVRTDMRNIAAHHTDTSAFAIDFDAVPGTQRVSQFQLEHHRVGHSSPQGSMYWGVAWSYYTLLQLSALGFLSVGAEKNYMSDCCEEVVHAHYRHVILSEAWMAVQD